MKGDNNSSYVFMLKIQFDWFIKTPPIAGLFILSVRFFSLNMSGEETEQFFIKSHYLKKEILLYINVPENKVLD